MRHLPRPSSYEEQIYSALVRPGDVCFDVGANQGEVSLFLARLAGEAGLVVAFEPVWPVYEQLCRHVQYDTTLKAAIVTVPAGLAETEKHAEIHVPDGVFGMGSMAKAAAWRKAHAGAALESYRARFTTIDSFLLTTDLRPPTFMKIDVEGGEQFVLQGAAELFSSGQRPLMLIEVFAPWEKAFGYGPWQLLSRLIERGYLFFFACPSGLVEYLPTETRPFPLEYEQGYNIVAYCPIAHANRIRRALHLRASPTTKVLPMVPAPCPNHMA
jgi:FkbM family methyltransferase